MTASTTRSRRAWLVGLLAIIGLVALWQLLSLYLPEILFPSPLATLEAGIELVRSGELASQLGRSLLRMLAGFALGVSAAIACGLVAGTSAVVYDAFRPVQAVLLGVPPIVFVVLAMVWFGTGGLVPVAVVAVLVFPLVFLSTADGRRNVDRQLLEMAAVYEVSRLRTLRDIVLPALAVPIFTAISLATGIAVRVTIMAELLAAADGVGYHIALARVNVDTATVFAWTIVLVGLVILVDHAVVGPMKRSAARWEA